MRPGHLARVTAALCAALLAGCDSATGNDGSFTITLSSAQVTVSQGVSTALTVSIARTDLDDPVSFAVEGLPTGVTGTFNPSPASGESTVLQLTAATSAPPATATVTVRATAPGAAEQSAQFSLEVLVAGNFTLSALDPTVTVAQGGGDRTSVLVNRTSGFSGTVALSITGAPAGLTATLDASATGNSALLTLAATGAVAAGSYPLTVTGSSSGVANQQTTVTVNVIAAPATASLTMTFCSNNLPALLAFKNEGSSWQVATAAGPSYTFAATDRLGVMIVFLSSNGANKQANITYGLRAEFAAFSGRDCAGTKRLNGTVAGVASSQIVRVAMGPAALNPPATSASPTFSFLTLPNRPMDLIGTTGTSGATFTPDKMIMHRDLDLADNASLPALDFGTADAFALQQGTLTIAGPAATEVKAMALTYWSRNATFGAVQRVDVSAGSMTLFGVPAARQVAGEVHELFLDHYVPQNFVGRTLLSYYATPGDRTETLGAFVNSPTITALASSPYLRLRARVTSQADYQSAIRLLFYQELTVSDTRAVFVQASAAYLGGTPSTWDVSIPDFSGLSGFNNGWMPVPTSATVWQVVGFNGRPALLNGAGPVDGDLLRYSDRTGQIGANPSLRAGSAAARRPSLPRSQYFSR